LSIKCLEFGHEVIPLGRTNNDLEISRCKALQQYGLKLQDISIDDRDGLARAAAGCDIAFHLAAAQHEANVPDSHFWDVNVEGTRNVLDAAVSGGLKRFVHGSTIGVYGAAEGELSEDSPLKPENIYGKTKLAGENLVLSYSNRIPVSVVRISETYGPFDKRLLKLFKAIKNRMFFMIGDGQNLHQLIYVDDLIDGLFAVAERQEAAGEVLVLAGTEVLSTNEMVQIIARELKVEIRRARSPIWPFLAVAAVMEKVLTPLGIQPPLHRRRLDFFRKSFYFNNEKAAKLIDFIPGTDFATGVAKTANWYSEHMDF
jgi:nucleoside-diphosphate-sugar epimerase